MTFEFLTKLLVYYAILTVFVYFVSDYVIYPAPKPSYVDSYNILKLTTSDGKKISAVYLPNPTAKYTILFSHGNGEDLGFILPFLKIYQQKGFAVFAYDYHGYGSSEGTPSEKNTYRDIDAAYQYLTEQLKIAPQQIILHGRSLGTGPSLDLAIRKPVGGIILESAMISAFRVLTAIPLFPVDKYENYQKILKLKVPVLFIHGTQDKVIPFWHGQSLYKRTTAPKYFLQVVGAGHNDVYNVAQETYWKTIIQFVQQLKLKP